jgi:hypothetical protein
VDEAGAPGRVGRGSEPPLAVGSGVVSVGRIPGGIGKSLGSRPDHCQKIIHWNFITILAFYVLVHTNPILSEFQ